MILAWLKRWCRSSGAALAALLLLSMASALAGVFEPLMPLPRSIAYDPAKADFGKRLFFDPRLSADGTVSCASCHDPRYGGADPRPVSEGVYGQKGSINAPTVFNSYFNFRQFWNGRAADLTEQASGPLHNPIEMGMTEADVLAVLRSDPIYMEMVREIYGSGAVRFEFVTDAIAEFEKALITPDSKLDRFLRGEVELNPDEAAGYRLFKRLGCATCHNGINIGGNSYQYLGAVVPVDIDASGGDRYAVTQKPFDRNRFKVPTLRNVALTAPYLHDGSQPTLEKQVEIMAYHNLGFRLTAEEVRVLVAFLHTLTGRHPEILQDP